MNVVVDTSVQVVIGSSPRLARRSRIRIVSRKRFNF